MQSDRNRAVRDFSTLIICLFALLDVIRLGPREVPPASAPTAPSGAPSTSTPRRGRPSTRPQAPEFSHQAAHPQPVQPLQVPSIPPTANSLAPPAPGFPYPVYHNAPHPGPRPMQPATSAPPQTWQAANGIAPHQTHIGHPHQHPHMMPRTQNPYGRDDHWNESFHPMGPNDGTHINPMSDNPAGYYDSRFRDDHQSWAGGAQDYYDQPVSLLPIAITSLNQHISRSNTTSHISSQIHIFRLLVRLLQRNNPVLLLRTPKNLVVANELGRK